MNGPWRNDGPAVLTNTRFGFRWGALEVRRLMDDDQYGTVILVATDNAQGFEIRASPQGRVVQIVDVKSGKQIS